VRVHGTGESCLSDHERRVVEEEPRLRVLGVGRQEPAGVIEVEVGQHDHIDVAVRKAAGSEAIEQNMAGLLHTEAVGELGSEEGAHAGFQQDGAITVSNQQAATREGNAIPLVWRGPSLP